MEDRCGDHTICMSRKSIAEVLNFLYHKVQIPRQTSQVVELWMTQRQRTTLKANRVFSLMVLGRTACLGPLVHSQHYSEDLINEQMAVLHAFNEQEGKSIVGFPSEPILSSRACVALKLYFRQTVQHSQHYSEDPINYQM